MDPLVDRTRWTLAGCAAFTQVTRLEARRLAEPGPRDHIQNLLVGLRAVHPRLESLMMYVVDDGVVVGFAEVIADDRGMRWHGPHVMPV